MDPSTTQRASFSSKKKTTLGLIEYFDELWEQTRDAFKQDRTWERARRLCLSSFVCLGRHTLTQMVTTAGREFMDWSADYRLFEKDRFIPEMLFDVSRREVLERIPSEHPLVVSLDDTVIRKRGKNRRR